MINRGGIKRNGNGADDGKRRRAPLPEWIEVPLSDEPELRLQLAHHRGPQAQLARRETVEVRRGSAEPIRGDRGWRVVVRINGQPHPLSAIFFMGALNRDEARAIGLPVEPLPPPVPRRARQNHMRLI